MKVLVATDFSETSAHAATLGALLARRLGDTVVLVHVLPRKTDSSLELAADASVLEAMLRERAAARMQPIARELRALHVDVEEVLVHGNAPADAICERARRDSPRMIVVGSQGPRSLARRLLGRVAERTATLACCPVLVVRGGADVLAPPDREDATLAVAVGVDRSEPSAAALEWIRQLRRATRCDVTFVHAYWPPDGYARLGTSPTDDRSIADAEVVRLLEAELESRIGTLPGEGRTAIDIRPCWGRPDAVLARESSAIRADLLVVGTHQRGLVGRLRLGSVSRALLRTASVPVVCVPAPHRAERRARPAAAAPAARE